MGLETLLLNRGLVSPKQVDEALAAQRESGERLDRVLLKMGHVDRAAIMQAVSDQFSMEIIDLASTTVDAETLALLPSRLIYRLQCVPISKNEQSIRVATSDPFDLSSFDELSLVTGMPIELVLADEEELRRFIRTHYGVAGDTLEALQAEQTEAVSELADDEEGQAELASVIRLVNEVLIEAIRERATDVHIEPYERHLSIRYRVDGLLMHASVPSSVDQYRNAIISRLKIMANLNVAERRLPQDGRITMRYDGRQFDLRLSVIPMIHGEGVVLRILDATSGIMPLKDLGMQANVLEPWDQAIACPHGLLLVTGPTGSGKSTTLYASLNGVITEEVKAITIEDPVEYHIEGLNQIQVHSGVGLSFAAGLRAVLRHDPDIVMVGEIRDRETAEAAIQASLTGHLVFSTLHTNDAAGAMPRLMDMGVEPFLVSSSVEGVLAQRLVRRICPDCRQTWTPEGSELPPWLDVRPGTTLAMGQGCRTCRQTGFRGRVGLYEFLGIGPRVRQEVIKRASGSELAAVAAQEGMLTTLAMAGRQAVLDGLTTPDEVARVAATNV
ncbi:MAG: GspE/PulE family protein [Phycisphaerales bacterium]|nr:GspE/PulE family protein [Phycisphaerales bacterium]